MEVEVGRCREHPGQGLDFWCREEGEEVCPHCLIFGAHRGHEAQTRQQRLVNLLPRVSPIPLHQKPPYLSP